MMLLHVGLVVYVVGQSESEVFLMICGSYCGVACIDGSCPKANWEEYMERDMPVVRSCNDCHYYKGCEDCAFLGTFYCATENLQIDNS